MDVSILLVLFCILEVVTPLVVMGIKQTMKGLNVEYNSTLIALVTSVVLSVGVSIFYMTVNDITFDVTSAMYILALIMANWLGSTLGYDKVKQALTTVKEETKE